MKVCLFLLALAAAVAADPAREHRAETRKLDKAARKFWRDFQSRFSEAYRNLDAPFSAKGGVDPEAVADHTDMRALFAEYRAIMEAWAKADEALGAAADMRAHEALFKELLGVCKQIQKREAELKKARPIDRTMFDQRPALLLDGLAVRLSGLVLAVAKWPELATTGWEKARKSDGKKSVLRRVAVVDALAIAGADLKPYVESDRMEIRIAVAESLFDRAALVPLLKDKEPAVRRALLQTILKKGQEQPAWVGPVLDALASAEGQEQADAVAVLGALTGQKFGYDSPAWQEWFDDYRKEIEGGGFDRTKIEIQEVKPKPAPASTTFYDIPTTSLRVVIATQADSIIFCPADWKHRRTKTEWTWSNTRRNWENRALPSHEMVLRRELGIFRESFAGKGRYGFVTLGGAFDARTSEKLVDLSLRSERSVNKLIDRMTGRGWCSPLIGIFAAFDLGDDIDTLYFVNNGELRGGTHATPELTLSAFTRWNRFRRVVVNTIRIDNQKDVGEALMKGLADASGGQYVWFEKPKP